jgi:hypothetical protein
MWFRKLDKVLPFACVVCISGVGGGREGGGGRREQVCLNLLRIILEVVAIGKVMLMQRWNSRQNGKQDWYTRSG